MAENAKRAIGADGALRDLSSSDADNHSIAHDRPGPQAQSNPRAVETEFDVEITLALTASGWRACAALLTLAAQLIEAGDFLGAERNRQRAREQFIEANDTFRQFQEARRAAADVIVAEAFL